MDVVRVRPMSGWAKNRKREHGNLFLVVSTAGATLRGEPALLLGCVNCVWRGWFAGRDAVIELIDSIEKGRYN